MLNPHRALEDGKRFVNATRFLEKFSEMCICVHDVTTIEIAEPLDRQLVELDRALAVAEIAEYVSEEQITATGVDRSAVNELGASAIAAEAASSRSPTSINAPTRSGLLKRPSILPDKPRTEFEQLDCALTVPRSSSRCASSW